MHHFEYRDGALFAEGVPLAQIAAQVGTPTYVYSTATLTRHYRVVDDSLRNVPHTICFAVKANSNLAVLHLLAELGSGFDIVSIGELRRVIAAGGDPAKTVFSGVGKRDDEIAAALQAGIMCLNIESPEELERIEAVAAALGVRAPISIRVNPEVDAQTHKYIATGLKSSKFGVPIAAAAALYRVAARSRHLQVIGIDSHIGSQILQIEPMVEAVAKVIALADELKRDGIVLQHLDIGGGLGIAYRNETPALPADLGDRVAAMVGQSGLHLLVEPGRVIAGNAGILLTRVLGNKHNGAKAFVIVDAAMNDLLRPALYDAWHQIIPVVHDENRGDTVVDVVGPVCESGDFLAQDRAMPCLDTGELVAVMSAGAYGFSMASNYNSRPRAAEVLVHRDNFRVVREREALTDLWRGETP